MARISSSLQEGFSDRVESAPVYYINEVPIIYKLSPSSPIIEIQSRGRKGFCKRGEGRVKSTRLCSSSLSAASKVVGDNDSLIDDDRTDFGLINIINRGPNSRRKAKQKLAPAVTTTAAVSVREGPPEDVCHALYSINPPTCRWFLFVILHTQTTHIYIYYVPWLWAKMFWTERKLQQHARRTHSGHPFVSSSTAMCLLRRIYHHRECDDGVRRVNGFYKQTPIYVIHVYNTPLFRVTPTHP